MVVGTFVTSNCIIAIFEIDAHGFGMVARYHVNVVNELEDVCRLVVSWIGFVLPFLNITFSMTSALSLEDLFSAMGPAELSLSITLV